MPEKGWRVISVKQEIYDFLMKEYQRTKHEWLLKNGINSFTGYVTYRLNQLAEEHDSNFEMLNHDGSGVKIIDRNLKRVADVTIQPEGIYCPVCDASNCEHIRFALRENDVLDIVRKRRKEGWHLPSV